MEINIKHPEHNSVNKLYGIDPETEGRMIKRIYDSGFARVIPWVYGPGFARVIPWVYGPGFARVIPWVYGPGFARALSRIKGRLGGLASLGPPGARSFEWSFEANFSYGYEKLAKKRRAQRRKFLSKSNGKQRARSRKRGQRNQSLRTRLGPQEQALFGEKHTDRSTSRSSTHRLYNLLIALKR